MEDLFLGKKNCLKHFSASASCHSCSNV